MIIVYLSVALLAVAFAVLVYFVSQTLKSAQKTLDHVASTMEGLERQLNGITSETTDLLHKTNRLADDISEKTKAFNTLFDSVKSVGDSMQSLNRSLRTVSDSVAKETERQAGQVSQAIQWSQAAIDIWARWKQKKQQVEGK